MYSSQIPSDLPLYCCNCCFIRLIDLSDGPNFLKYNTSTSAHPSPIIVVVQTCLIHNLQTTSPVLFLLPFQRPLVVSTRVHYSSPTDIVSENIQVTSERVRVTRNFSVVILLSLRSVLFFSEESCLVFSPCYSCPCSLDLSPPSCSPYSA